MSVKILYKGYLYSISTGANNQGVALIYNSDEEIVTITPTQQFKVEAELHLAAQHQIDQLHIESNVPQAGDFVNVNGHQGVIESLLDVGGIQKAVVVVEPKSIFRAIHDGLPTIKAQDGQISLLIEPGTLTKHNKVTGDFFGFNNNTQLNFRLNVNCWEAEGLPLVPRYERDLRG
jgi:hypothetical protein